MPADLKWKQSLPALRTMTWLQITDQRSMPSVERFNDDDLGMLVRKRCEFALECAICLADVLAGEDTIQLPCAARHVFHDECARSWLSRNVTCPLCRVDVRALIRSQRRMDLEADALAAPVSDPPSPRNSPRAFGYTRDGGVITRYEPRPPAEVGRPHYIPVDLHHVAELVEVEYPDRGTARVWRVPRGL
ncbi:unnamed protein product [Durusdinium trenchii]|uniref:RING-type domain-containing protein n=1 Tax=Durusdinium trenchii TaxID=1381693 RepID=A0ABP0PLI6_9DINO